MSGGWVVFLAKNWYACIPVLKVAQTKFFVAQTRSNDAQTNDINQKVLAELEGVEWYITLKLDRLISLLKMSLKQKFLSLKYAQTTLKRMA
jgi:hypothetical protein